jgi:hypothetical protein
MGGQERTVYLRPVGVGDEVIEIAGLLDEVLQMCLELGMAGWKRHGGWVVGVAKLWRKEEMEVGVQLLFICCCNAGQWRCGSRLLEPPGGSRNITRRMAECRQTVLKKQLLKERMPKENIEKQQL